ncbi:twin-arginine translocation pathway signal protein [Microbacterium paludicola]|uniref:Thiamine pyrimidine synthase n=1 Tax=Microbacterium paludicola TaxID=300019 RepID=A0A4Y9FVS1_9MICO|nr:ABC transporter substrate-binding protein [Microbacterium paludicola]MBF0816021.1 ABC transporter substrate-binding protein [Microbacterium paludicola]TFU33340.1 twin-arginine translocation pathway signal protein [Microbacterium paludicola]
MIRSPYIRRGLAAAGLTLTGAIALSACAGGAAPAAEAEGEDAGHGSITVQQSWIKNEEFAGEFYATTKGYYEEAGFDEVTLLEGPSTGVAELMGGTVQVALNDPLAVGAAVANEGATIKMIGATFQKNPFTVLSLKDGADIATVDDLKGKKIGVQDSNRAAFDAFLEANGIGQDELEIVAVQYDPAPLTNGEVDGFYAYLTNEALTVKLAGNEITNLPLADNGFPLVAETVSVTDQYLAENRELLKDFLVAEIKGWTDVLADPEQAAEDVVADFGTDLDPVKTLEAMNAQAELISTPDTEANGLFTITEEMQQATVDSLAGAGIDVAVEDIFDLSLLDEVYAENPELVDYAG